MIKVEKDLKQAGERKAERPCIFLIQAAINRKAAMAIGDYITQRGEMDIWLDLFDEPLASEPIADADRRERFLAEGLAQATHILGLTSPEAPHPWWATRAAELGRASDVELALLTLKGMTDDGLSYHSFEILRGIRSLNEYLFRVSPDVDRIIFNNPAYGGLMAHTAPNHPLDTFLDWEK